MPNLSALSPATTAATSLSNLVLVSPQSVKGYQPQNPTTAASDGQETAAQQLPPALLFHYEGEQTVTLESDITDHYVEDNTAVQDQIALKPEVVTTHGFIGELNDVTPEALERLRIIADKLTSIVAYQPVLTTTAELAYAEAFQLYQVGANAINAAVSAWNNLSGGGGENVIGSGGVANSFNQQTGRVANSQNKQQTAFQQFYGYWRNRTLFTVQTPWAIFQNMAIKSLRAIQDAETRMITDFEVSFKMIRTASTLRSITTTYQTRGRSQSSSLTDQGTSTPSNSIGLGTGLANMGVA